jgi:hypothetical protein
MDIIPIMKRHSPDLETALRVLGAIIERREPDAADLRRLQEAMDPDGHLPADELACEVIQRSVVPLSPSSQRL